MKILKTDKKIKLPPNKVMFQVSPEMTRIDVKNYLEQIYNTKVLSVATRNVSGKIDYLPYHRPREMYKETDIKYAIVTLVSFLDFLRFSIIIFFVFSQKIINSNFRIFYKQNPNKKKTKKAP